MGSEKGDHSESYLLDVSSSRGLREGRLVEAPRRRPPTPTSTKKKLGLRTPTSTRKKLDIHSPAHLGSSGRVSTLSGILPPPPLHQRPSLSKEKLPNFQRNHRWTSQTFVIILLGIVCLSLFHLYAMDPIEAQALESTSTDAKTIVRPAPHPQLEEGAMQDNDGLGSIAGSDPNNPPRPDYHIVFSTSCSRSQDWESYVFFYHAMKVQQPGSVTRIVSGCNDQQRQERQHFFDAHIRTMRDNDSFHIHFTPDYSRIELDHGKPYKYMNKREYSSVGKRATKMSYLPCLNTLCSFWPSPLDGRGSGNEPVHYGGAVKENGRWHCLFTRPRFRTAKAYHARFF